MSIFGIEIEIGTVSLLGIAAALAIILITRMAARESERVLMAEKELASQANKFKEAFSAEIAFVVSDTQPQSSIHGTTYAR